MSPTGTVTPPYPRHFPPAISAGMRSEAFIRRCSSRCCRRAGRPAVFLLRCGHPISRGIGRAACDVVANPSHQSFRCRAIARVRCGRQNRAVRFYSVSRFRARIGSGSSVQNASMPEADRQSFLQVFTRLCPPKTQACTARRQNWRYWKNMRPAYAVRRSVFIPQDRTT